MRAIKWTVSVLSGAVVSSRVVIVVEVSVTEVNNGSEWYACVLCSAVRVDGWMVEKRLIPSSRVASRTDSHVIESHDLLYELAMWVVRYTTVNHT